MGSKKPIVAALCALADELANGNRSQDGFALLKEPVGVQTWLEPKFPDADWDDLGLKGDQLIYMGWEGALTSSVMSYDVVKLPSGRRLYLRCSDDEELMIVSVSTTKWTPRTDVKFLQYVFRNPYDNFDCPPSDISTFLPFPFLVDLFTTWLDTMEDGWEKLIEYSNEEHDSFQNEKPRDPRPPQDISSPTLRARAEYRKALNKAVKEMRLQSDFNQKRPDDPDDRKRIVARFLAHALKAGMRWRKRRD